MADSDNAQQQQDQARLATSEQRDYLFGAATDEVPATAPEAVMSCAHQILEGVRLRAEGDYSGAAARFREVADAIVPGEVMTVTVPRPDGAQQKKFTRLNAIAMWRDARFFAALAALQSDPLNKQQARAIAAAESSGRLSGSRRRTSDMAPEPDAVDVGEGMMDVDPDKLQELVERENLAWLELADSWPNHNSPVPPRGFGPKLSYSNGTEKGDTAVVRGETVTRMDAAKTATTWCKGARRHLAVAYRARANARPYNSSEAREDYIASLTVDPSAETNAVTWNNLAVCMGNEETVRISDDSYTRIDCFLNALVSQDLQARVEVWANAIRCFGDGPQNVPRFGNVTRQELIKKLIFTEATAPPPPSPSRSREQLIGMPIFGSAADIAKLESALKGTQVAKAKSKVLNFFSRRS